jgi:CBS domain-containing protein
MVEEIIQPVIQHTTVDMRALEHEKDFSISPSKIVASNECSEERQMNAHKDAVNALGESSNRVTELFHRLNSVLPEDQHVVSVGPDMLAIEALDKLKELRFSQLPVVVGREVLGLFSFQSFANAVVTHGRNASKNQKFTPLDLLVEDCMVQPTFARVTDEFADWFDFIDQHDSVLVGEPNRLQGIVTAMDILRYLYRVASPFVLVAEVELALRALINLAVSSETLAVCAKDCLKDKYPDGLPTRLEEMTFNDYVQIIGDGRCWEHFQNLMGGNRVRTRAKLEQLRDIRNLVFHFKREITVEEYETLAAGRQWMLIKARAAEARREDARS